MVMHCRQATCLDGPTGGQGQLRNRVVPHLAPRTAHPCSMAAGGILVMAIEESGAVPHLTPTTAHSCSMAATGDTLP